MYYKRENEVQKSINNAKKDFEGTPLTLSRDLTIVQTAIDNYFVARRKILDNLIEFLEDETRNVQEQRIRWENYLNAKSFDAFRPLRDVLKYNNTSTLTIVVSELVSQESVFFLRLANMQIPDVMHAKLVEYRKQYQDEKKNLLEKWQKLENENQNINVSIEETTTKLRNIYQTTISKIDANKEKIRNSIVNYIKPLNSAVGVIAGVSLPSEAVDAIFASVETFNHFTVGAKELARRFDELYKSEENVAVIMFGNTRKSVKEFLEKTNFDKCQSDYINASKHAYENAEGMLTEGQRVDAAVFVREAEKLTKRRMTSFTDSYNHFVNDNKEIFIGPVGDRTVWNLIRKERWDCSKNEFQVINIQTELKRIYNETRNWINIDMYNLTPEIKQQVVAAIKKDIEKFDLALNSTMEARSLWEGLHLSLSITKELIFSKIKNT